MAEIFSFFLISLPINAIIVYIQANSRKRTKLWGGIYCTNQSYPIITDHIQSQQDGGIASSHVTFPHSFSITPHWTHRTL